MSLPGPLIEWLFPSSAQTSHLTKSAVADLLEESDRPDLAKTVREDAGYELWVVDDQRLRDIVEGYNLEAVELEAAYDYCIEHLSYATPRELQAATWALHLVQRDDSFGIFPDKESAEKYVAGSLEEAKNSR